ncbi:phosphomethylpyrimidine kinase domain-containing protein [Ditylenchus destructor]|uniref:Pyridoxal kinase n=1 Tax=Ditylenchus destructor TaxID=166010 RepID=A0AAD4R5J6_9BILA|nr:phosphomethylpyrimidine kinase domain-containing protein [Ditylenchus destructor]
MSLLEDRIKKHRRDLRVLSIQSHVISGYAGNKCSVFPLQLHGFEVDVINSVQFSNHTGYANIRGGRLTSKDLSDLFEGLKLNQIDKYSHILTGYCGDASFLREVSSMVSDLKCKNDKLVYVCDPVLGDNGKYYAPEELMPIYRDEILPLAEIITPNVFELSQLSGMNVTTEAECLNAINDLHKLSGVPIIVVTSGMTSDTGDVSYCYASRVLSRENQKAEVYRFEIPIVRGIFVGTGDVFASLLLVWLTETEGNIVESVCKVICSLQSLLKRTSATAFAEPIEEGVQPSISKRELRLIESRYDLLVPTGNINYVKL